MGTRKGKRLGNPIRKALQPKEGDIQKGILELLFWKGIFAWRNNTTGVYDPTRKSFRKSNNLLGVSDILGILPDGRFLAIEVKSKVGRVSLEQTTFLENINRNGGLAFVARSISDVEKLLADLPKRVTDKQS